MKAAAGADGESLARRPALTSTPFECMLSLSPGLQI